MRITKKIISLLLVLSMLASFVAMSGFEASAALTGQQKTDFGLHFDDTTRKFKVLQLSDIQTDVGDSNISAATKQTIRQAMQKYEPDLILLSGDQTQGGSGILTTLSDWKSSINAVFNTFEPHMSSECKVIAVPGNHEYDYGNLGDQWDYYNSQSWYLDWDNNFSTVDLNGEPGAGNVTVSATSSNTAVALNIALFNSKGDDEDGYLRPGGDDDTAYQQIVDWYTATNNTLASSAYSYKAQVTGASSAYVPAFGMQHVILQEIYGCMESTTSSEGVATATDGNYSALFSGSYMKFKSSLPYTGVLGEAPCPSTLGAGATDSLYHALLDPGNFLGMCFGHDHLNTFDITDSNGFRFLMGGALTSENYNNGNPNVRYMEFTLDDATGEVTLRSELASYNSMNAAEMAEISEDRIEALDSEGNPFVNSISVPKTIYVGSSENNDDPRAVQKKGTAVQPLLLDYETKSNYEQDLTVLYSVPASANVTSFGATNTTTDTAVTLDTVGSTSSSDGSATIWELEISTSNNMSDGDIIQYYVKYTYDGDGDGTAEEYEIYNASSVENIKMPAGYTDWFRSWRVKDSSAYYLDLHYVGTLSGVNAFSYARDTNTNDSDPMFISNIHWDYTPTNGRDLDSIYVNHAGNGFYSMYWWSPSRVETSGALLAKRSVYDPPRTDIYLDVSTLEQISDLDTRLDTGVRIDFWMPQTNANSDAAYVAGIGFYAGDQDYVYTGATIDPSDSYADYQTAADAELDDISAGDLDDPGVFLYNSYAGQQAYAGLGTTHTNANLTDANRIGNLEGDSVGYPLVVDSESAALALNGVGMTMFTGVRVKGSTTDGYRQMNYAIAPYYLYFNTYDMSELRGLMIAELCNFRILADYPNASEQLWSAYIDAYKNAVTCYAQVRTNQSEIDSVTTNLNNAIVALMNSNKGTPDESTLLKGESQLTSIAVPPIIYVSGTTIQTASPYTDRALTYTVPENAYNVSCTVVGESSDTVNSAVTTSTSYSGTSYTTTVTGGTATAGGGIYYKISWTMPDVNGDGKADTFCQYAASYVKGVPHTEGVWVSKTRNKGGWGGSRKTQIHIKATVSLTDSVLSARGVSAIVALYGGVQGTSFSDTVVGNYSGNYTGHPSGSTPSNIYWSVGSGNLYNGSNGYEASNRVVFYNNRSSENAGDNAYWDGLYPYTTSVNSSRSHEYIVTHFYFDPQATGAATQPQLYLSLTTADDDCNTPYIRRYWDSSDYSSTNFGGKYTENDISNTGMFSFAGTGNNWENSDNNCIEDLADGAVYTAYIKPSSALSNFSTSYSRMILQGEKKDTKYNYSTVGFAFVFNRVDRSAAHQVIKWVTGGEIVTPSALFVESEMDADWWSQWRSEIMKAYIACGNLWGSDYATNAYESPIVNLWQNPVYKDADYSELVSLINKITSQGLVEGTNEHISNYTTVKYTVNGGDDSRYVGESYESSMFVNNAAYLISVIRNRTAVYGDVDDDNDTTSEINKNFHKAHLDIRFQSYIDDYVDDLQAAWDALRLADADFTTFDKFTNYYNSTDDTVYFLRDQYAGYANDSAARDYANEKNLASAMFTAATRKAFIESLNVDRTLKKPSETMVVGSLPQIYPLNYKYTFKNVTSPDTTVCLYNTARDAYEGLEFRRAGEYYSSTGTYTEGGVTYYANYNKQDRGGSYYYIPVFTASYNSLTADVTNGGFVVTDAKVSPVYTAGNAANVAVTDGAGNTVSYVSKYTAASWGGDGETYGFADAYVANLGADSTYQTTNSSSSWVLALYAETEICQDIAAVDYYYDKLKANSADTTQLTIQQNSYAEYEKGGSGYDALSGYVIVDEDGNVLTDGAQWYTAATWSTYTSEKATTPDTTGMTLAEAQAAVNAQTQAIYQARNALALRTMEDYRTNTNVFDAVTADEDILNMSEYDASKPENELSVLVPAGTTYAAANNFAAINEIIGYYNAVVGNQYVGVFASRYDLPQDRSNVEGNSLLYKKHYFYNEAYRTSLAAKSTAIDGYAGKPMATNIANYLAAVEEFKTLYGQKADNLNTADYQTLNLMLNKAWIPEYDTYGTGNYKDGTFLLGSTYTGADWYTEETWTEYFNARETAAKFYEGQTTYDGYNGYSQNYGTTIHTNGLLVDSQGSNSTTVDGSINKAAYDLLVAYYKLQYKKVSDYEGTVAGLTGTYAEINEQLDALLLEKENETLDVVIVNQETGLLETVQKSVYSATDIELARTFKENILALENEDLGPNYSAYVNAVNNYKTVIENLAAASVYLDGWNGIFEYLNTNAGDTVTIADSGTLTSYFNAVYTGFNPATIYATDGQSINNIFSTKTMYDGFGLLANQGQAQYNTLVTNFYNELNAASFVPSQVTRAEEDAEAKIADSTKAAYDPLQLNGRTKVTEVSKYSPESIANVRAKIAEIKATTITLWETDTTVTGYNDNAGTAVDGSLADEIWAAAGLTTETGDKDYDGADRDGRYLLEEGGQFLEALTDALAYAKGELYDDEGNVKTFDVLTGAGETITSTIFTDDSVAELVEAIAAGDQVTNLTTQDDIDQAVFDILEQTDIANTIKLLTADGGFGVTLEDVAEDDGLKYKDADYTYYDEELATALEAKSDGAAALIEQIWIDNGDGTFALNNALGAKYFTEDTWTPYYTAYLDALKADAALTAKDQGTINTHTTTVYSTREALTWNGIDESTQTLIDSIGSQIDSLSTTFVTVYTYTNSVVSVRDDGTRVMTAPSMGTVELSPYGDVTHITSLWESFRANYLEAEEELDITKQAEMLENLTEIQDMLAALETKKFSVDEDNEFTVGVRSLVDTFIAGTYTFNGIASSDGVGTYTADYLTTADGTNISAAEQLVRSEQQIAIQNKLNAIYTILGSNFEVGDVYIDYSTGVAVRYETALDAVNALTEDLYNYVTGQPGTDYESVRAQYAGFALDMRQDMYDFFSTEITVYVYTRRAAADPLYTRTLPLFAEGTLENAQSIIDGDGEDDLGMFGNVENWPTINQLDDSVGITLDDTVPIDHLMFNIVDADGNETGEMAMVADEIMGQLNGYSSLYGDNISSVNTHDASALMWLTTEAIYDTGSEVYFLANPASDVTINDSVFAYTMNSSVSRDGDWYTDGYGINIGGSSYYLAAGEDPESVTGSSYGGWFTDATYEAVMEQKSASDEFIVYADTAYGDGPTAAEVKGEVEANANDYGICWSSDYRDAFIEAVKDDQSDVDTATATMYEKLCALKLLNATDAYRYVAGLIYDALGLIPTYSADNNSDIIIVDDTVGTTEENPLGGRVFNISLLSDLDDLTTPGVDYTIVTDDSGTYYYSTMLPSGYDGGVEAVEYILNTVFAAELVSMYTIDKAALVTGDTNSVKSRVVAELEALGLGLADLSKITSLTAAFLYNNPSNATGLGSLDINDNSVGEEFFGTTHPILGTTGNAFIYRNDLIMKSAGSAYHASGFYDFTKYTEASLREVIEFLGDNDIINATTQANANNFNSANSEGFDIEFDPDSNGDTLYSTPKTQQATVDSIYEELVTLINALELKLATTTTLEEAISSADDIMIDESIYDHEATDADGDNIWNEFTQALTNANNYVGVTVINEAQVAEAEDRLEKAIKALVLYVDTFAPVLTVHNTQSDLTKFYAAHEAELKNTIASADQMVTVSHIEPGLGGYTLYVYTNQLNPQIVLSLKDTTSALNDDGSTRSVTTSKPEKLTVSAQAMSGVTANVITPVLDGTDGTALSSQVVTLGGGTTVSAQTAKNAEGTYDADSSAYIILTPQFTDSDGVQQAAAYTIDATDSAVTKDSETGEISSSINTASQFNYSNDTTLIDNTNDGKITVFVYYMNAMPEDGSDDGVNADGSVNASAVLTHNEYKGLAADEWSSQSMLYRTFATPVRSWEFSETQPQLATKNASYYDPTFGENNFGSFVYILDPDATSGLDYDIASTYFTDGADAAKAAFISALNSNSEYIATFGTEFDKYENGTSTKFYGYGATTADGEYENWAKSFPFDNGTLAFIHVADRFGNVCNRLIELSNYDPYAPVLTADEAGAATVTEPGGSGIAKVDLFEYMGTQGGSLYIDYLFDMLHVEDFTYVSEDNSFTIQTGVASKLFTVAVTDNAGNVGSVPVYSDENGDIVLTAVETYENVASYAADSANVEVNSGEDLALIEFTFNSTETVILNYGSLSSIVKAGPDGNVFAEKKNVPLNIVADSDVESIKLYDVDNGTEEIWTADNATITDNGDGTSTWTVKYTFTEGEHNYTATAMVDGEWELSSVAFSFVATTKSVEVRLSVNGIGKIRFGYNEGNYSNVPVMSKKSVPYGSVVTLEAVQTEEGSDFYYWINNGSGRIISTATTYEFVAVTNMDLTSQFTTNECFVNGKKLVVYVNNAENVIENFELEDGEDYTVPAAPSLPDHVFKNWSMSKEEILASDETMIIVRPVYSLVVTNTVTLTEGNWTTTGAGEYQSVDNERALVSISASAQNDDGASFLYWLDAETGDIASYNRSYSFHAIKDTELTPVYGDASAVVPVPVARIATVKYDEEAGKVNFYAERSVPSGYDLIKTGVIVTKTASVGTDEEAFILDASGVGKGISNSTASNGVYAAGVTVTAGTVAYARAFIIYQNADGDIITAYSPITSYQA